MGVLGVTYAEDMMCLRRFLLVGAALTGAVETGGATPGEEFGISPPVVPPRNGTAVAESQETQAPEGS